MGDVGPALPPHVAARRREKAHASGSDYDVKHDDDDHAAGSDGDGGDGAAGVAGPALPPHLAARRGQGPYRDDNHDGDDDDDGDQSQDRDRDRKSRKHKHKKKRKHKKRSKSKHKKEREEPREERREGQREASKDEGGTDRRTQPAGPQMPPELLERIKQGDIPEEAAPARGEDESGSRAVAGTAASSLSNFKQHGRPQQQAEHGGAGGVDRDDDDDDDDDAFGPMPATAKEMEQAEIASIRRGFAEREEVERENERKAQAAKQMQRESWMTELPERHRKNFGVTNRTFRQKYAATDDGSSWTATPNASGQRVQKPEKPDPRKRKSKHEAERQREIEEQVQAYNAQRRNKSLMEMHQHKLKKPKKEKDPDIMPSGRTRFNRERDVVGQNVTISARDRMIKKAAGFHSRFTQGSF